MPDNRLELIAAAALGIQATNIEHLILTAAMWSEQVQHPRQSRRSRHGGDVSGEGHEAAVDGGAEVSRHREESTHDIGYHPSKQESNPTRRRLSQQQLMEMESVRWPAIKEWRTSNRA